MTFKNLIWAALSGAALSACSGSGTTFDDTPTADTLTHHARYLTIAERPDGVVLVDIADPWNEEAAPFSYALVNRDSVLPENLPANAKIVRTPVQKAAVYTQLHTSAMDELGSLGSLVAIADARYFPAGDTVISLMADKKIVDLGTAQNPSSELVAASGAEVVMRSPVQGVVAPQLPPAVVPVELVDYMEASPIGRAEWMLLYGELFGKRAEATSIFEKVIDDYSSLVFKVGSSELPDPKLLVETETSGVWYVPAGQSYAARLYADAGADYPWADTEGQGSIALSLEEVASKALDADLWLVRSFGYETTPGTLKALNPRYASFEALKNGEIYSCNSLERLIFTEGAYHPERLLAEYISIFHPDVMPGYERRYFLKQNK